MGEQSSLGQEVQALQLLAERGDWNACRAATEALLLRLPASHAVRLTRDFLERRLPAFERQQPGVLWPRELLALAEGTGPSASNRVWPFEDEFPGPGANGFTKALECLWLANQRMTDVKRCVAELVDAISDAILAETSEHWGSRHPEEWAIWYRLASSFESSPRTADIQLAKMRDPDVKRLKRAAWLELAGSLEAALRAK
jgi:hypothetical protein